MEKQQRGAETRLTAKVTVALSKSAIFGDISEANMAYTEKKATSINRGSFLAIDMLDTERTK
jgi:hypothetical protein